MLYLSVEAMLQQVSNQRRPLVYWQLMQHGHKEPIAVFMPEDNEESPATYQSTSLDHLRTTLATLPDGRYELTGWSKPNGHNRNQRIPFAIGQVVGINGVHTAAINAPDAMTDRAYDLISRQLESLTAQLDVERQRNNQLAAELAQAKADLVAKDVDLRILKIEQKHAEKPDATTRLLESYAPAINGLVGKFMAQPGAIAGPGLPAPSNAETAALFSEDEERRASAAMDLLAEKLTAPAATMAIEQLAAFDQATLQRLLPKLPQLQTLAAAGLF